MDQIDDIERVTKIVDTIENFDVVKDLPNSSFNIFLGKRRSGKSVLCEYMIKQMIDAKMVNFVFLFSPTNAGFEFIDNSCRFTEIDNLHNILENFRKFNSYNKIQTKKSLKFEYKCVIILDDMAVKLKSKEFNILDELACNGRHSAYEPLSLSFMILSQSLTKVSRCCRLNVDNIFLNTIPSKIELEILLSENFYILDSSRSACARARMLYHQLVVKNDYQFIAILNYKQNVTNFKDYIKLYRAELD